MPTKEELLAARLKVAAPRLYSRLFALLQALADEDRSTFSPDLVDAINRAQDLITSLKTGGES